MKSEILSYLNFIFVVRTASVKNENVSTFINIVEKYLISKLFVSKLVTYLWV
jgi:hypothetical protein